MTYKTSSYILQVYFHNCQGYPWNMGTIIHELANYACFVIDKTFCQSRISITSNPRESSLSLVTLMPMDENRFGSSLGITN